MPLEDKDIFNAVFDKYRDQPIEFVMAQYEKAKLLNRDIERRLSAPAAGQDAAGQGGLPATAEPQSPAPEEKSAPQPPRKRFTKKDLVADPETAITDDGITCCICGQRFNTLTARHLKNHDISVEEYKYLCGYTSAQKLMSFNLAATLARNVQKAQAARKARLQERENPA